MSTQTFNLSMDRNLVLELDEYSKEEGQTRSAVIRRLTESGLAVWREKKAKRDRINAIKEFGRITDDIVGEFNTEEIVGYVRQLRGQN
jgi:metal-responsive CopG/Arc/MetJ family transcriptional regulator